MGGPDGGNGGKGGQVIFRADKNLATLLDFRYRRQHLAEDGKPGEKKKCSGRRGQDMIIRVPEGTLIKNSDTEEVLYDLVNSGDEFIAAKGGRGGRGNSEFATATNQAPRYAEEGKPGAEINILMELKLLADVGLVGFPNAGKSTLISSISAAKPKIADYPFTTLIPNLGIVKVSDYKSFTIADIPGLIEGAHEGKGLGIQFLRHVERTSVLIFLIDCMSEDPVNDYRVLLGELEKYNPEMLDKQKIICISKVDVLDSNGKKELEKIDFKEENTDSILISSVAQMGLETLKQKIWKILEKE
jgi:GTPase